jgi:hypothetical protein
MSTTEFVYVTYINTTPQKVWNALLDNEMIKPGSKMLEGIKAGWPSVLSSFKTLLETGNPLQMTTKRWSGPPE